MLSLSAFTDKKRGRIYKRKEYAASHRSSAQFNESFDRSAGATKTDTTKREYSFTSSKTLKKFI